MGFEMIKGTWPKVLRHCIKVKSNISQAFKEEVGSYSDKYDSCVQAGITVLDKSDSDTAEAHQLNRKIEQVCTKVDT